jgi:hypothetical protein
VARTAIVVASLAVLFSCSSPRVAQPGTDGQPSSQQTYEYPGCRNDNAECPRMGALACALRTIASKYNTCSKHAECLEATLGAKCSGAGTCPPYFVNRQSKAAFESEAQHEIDRYCERGTCSASGLCGIIEMEAYCASGHCTWINVFGPVP